MSEQEAVWVISDVAPDGTHVATIQASSDVAIALEPERAIRYAMAVIGASVRAEYDAAVFAQMTAMGELDERTALEPIIHLREDRPDLDHEATRPLRFEPVVTSRKKQPVVHVFLGGAPLSEWTPDEAKGHALHVLEVTLGVDLDAAYRRVLVGGLGLDDKTARAVVGQLGRHRG